MYLLRKPSDLQIQRFLEDQAPREFTYPEIGGTRTRSFPAGYTIDETRAQLGHGGQIFERATAALKHWQQFKISWLKLYSPAAAIQPGTTVGLLVRSPGLWVLNACRVVYVVDEIGPIRRFGYAYGTLPEHAESGEELFQTEWNTDDDTVWYSILAFSKPWQCQARIAKPYVRSRQKQFAVDCTRAMQKAVGDS
jgi:uncharacterized protein (UPF0548 family)